MVRRRKASEKVSKPTASAPLSAGTEPLSPTVEMVLADRLGHLSEMMTAGKFSEVAFAFVLRGEPAKALATTGQWMLAVPSELHPVLAVRRAHALAFLGRDEEAKGIYRSYRGRLVERGLTVERLMADDLAQLEAAGQTLPPPLRDKFQQDNSAA